MSQQAVNRAYTSVLLELVACSLGTNTHVYWRLHPVDGLLEHNIFSMRRNMSSLVLCRDLTQLIVSSSPINALVPHTTRNTVVQVEH